VVVNTGIAVVETSGTTEIRVAIDPIKFAVAHPGPVNTDTSTESNVDEVTVGVVFGTYVDCAFAEQYVLWAACPVTVVSVISPAVAVVYHW
jgi:hypothetical protein